jgi:alcohol dehydrogenase, propanol-preferring
VDGKNFFAHIRTIDMRTVVTPYPLGDANVALDHLREGRLSGAAVLIPG